MKSSLMQRALTLAAVLIVGAVAIARGSVSEPAVLRSPLDQLPMQIAGWTGRSLPELDPRVREQLNVDEYVDRAYSRSRAEPSVGLFIAYYQSQRQGQALHSPLNCLPGSGWQPIKSGRVAIGGAPGDPSGEINRYVIQKAGVSQLVLYWYQSHGRIVASEYWGKVFLVADAIRLNRTDAALVRVVVPMRDNEPGAEAAAETAGMEFVRTVLPLLGRHLPA